MSKDNNEFNFEKSLTDLETVVTKLESEGISLEDSLKDFEKGVNLAQQCEVHLQKAEQTVQILVNSMEDGQAKLEKYNQEN